MRRRQFLAGSLAGLGLAGCVGRSPGGGTDTETETGTPMPTLVGSDLQVNSNECGQQVDQATVSFDPEGRTVAVEGVVWGSDTCHTARLADATYTPDTDRLTVRVVATVPETTETQACGQCIVEIAYEATCSFDGGLPGTVRVVHGRGDGERVVTNARR